MEQLYHNRVMHLNPITDRFAERENGSLTCFEFLIRYGLIAVIEWPLSCSNLKISQNTVEMLHVELSLNDNGNVLFSG